MADKTAMMTSTLYETARYITTQHIHYAVELGDLDLSMWLTMTSGVTGFDLIITDANGIVESYSDRSLFMLGKTVPNDVLSIVNTGENTIGMSSLGELYNERRQVSGAALVMGNNGDVQTFGYLFVASDIAMFRQEWRSFYSILIIIALSIMLAAFILTYVATKKHAEPLNEMANAARRFARGEFSVRVGERGRKDEIGQLTVAFNAMADSLESSEQLRRDFITNLSHELNTPMTVIAGFAEGLLDGTIPREDEARYLGIVSTEARRLARVVRSMMEISTLQSSDASTVFESNFDVSEVVRIALLSLDRKIEEKQLGVEAELPDETIITRGDSDSIIQVVYNLIDNSIKFSEPEGVISLELWKQESKVYVSVTNMGEEIPEDELPHIFTRFHKADKSRSSHEGAGMGLFIAKKILDTHNEDIYVTSTGGVTKFIFSLTIA